MPLDIGEIGVRVNVRDAHEDRDAKPRGEQPCGGCYDGGATRLAPSAQSEIVRECVRQVLQALQREGMR